jgi:hypothetical protein
MGCFHTSCDVSLVPAINIFIIQKGKPADKMQNSTFTRNHKAERIQCQSFIIAGECFVWSEVKL